MHCWMAIFGLDRGIAGTARSWPRRGRPAKMLWQAKLSDYLHGPSIARSCASSRDLWRPGGPFSLSREVWQFEPKLAVCGQKTVSTAALGNDSEIKASAFRRQNPTG